MVKKRQVCLTLPEDLVIEMENIRDETGVPLSVQANMRMRGYGICRLEDATQNTTLQAQKPTNED